MYKRIIYYGSLPRQMLFCDEKVCAIYQNTIAGLLILTISSQRHVLTCDEHDKEIADMGEAIEHLRPKHVSFIRRPGCLGEADTHGHYWYCFDCGSGLKDHRSFNSDKAIWSHLKNRHSYIMDYYPGLLWS